jgi:hypothetical protein
MVRKGRRTSRMETVVATTSVGVVKKCSRRRDVKDAMIKAEKISTWISGETWGRGFDAQYATNRSASERTNMRMRCDFDIGPPSGTAS